MQFFLLNLCCRLVLSDVIVLGSLRSHVERVEKNNMLSVGHVEVIIFNILVIKEK